MAKPTAGKWRALRVELREHNKPDVWIKTRIGFTIVAFLVVTGWFLAGLMSRDRSTVRFSPGPLSANHEHFSCISCHDDFSPMRDDVWSARWKGWHGTAGGRWDRGSDQKCLQCHPLAAMPGTPGKQVDEIMAEFHDERIEKPLPIFAHSQNELTSKVASCASCHVEHQGADFQLTKVTNDACVRCHENLTSCIVKSTEPDPFPNKITNFAVDHPVFRSLKTDPGTLRDFNHRLHLWPGLSPPVDGAPGRKQYQPSDFGEAAGSLARYVDPGTGNVHLRCEFCHKQAGDTVNMAATAANLSQLGGKSEFMTMPNYEQSCKICHPLDILPGSDRLIEHGLAPDATRNRLIEILTVQSIQNDLNNADPDANRDEEQELLARKIWEAIKNREDLSSIHKLRDSLQKAEDHLRLRCGKCHEWSNSAETRAADITVGPIRTIGNGNEVYLKRWLKYGRFDHYEHRDFDCARCHAAAYAKQYEERTNKRASEKNSDVLIADHNTCVQCHQPVTKVQSGNRAAPYNCTFCHTYHGGGNRTHQILNLTTE